jgi:hypothetical protein
MQYLVTGEFIDPGPLLPPEQLVEMIRQAIVPSHDALTNLKSEGKLIAGGYSVGEGWGVYLRGRLQRRVGQFIAEFAFLGLLKIKATPLEDVEGRRERDRQQAD